MGERLIGGAFISHLGEDASSAALLANVSEPADIVLFAFLLVTTLVVGFALLGVDAVVRRIRLRRAPTRTDPSDEDPPPQR